jgi:hypothetical protein
LLAAAAACLLLLLLLLLLLSAPVLACTWVRCLLPLRSKLLLLRLALLLVRVQSTRGPVREAASSSKTCVVTRDVRASMLQVIHRFMCTEATIKADITILRLGRYSAKH